MPEPEPTPASEPAADAVTPEPAADAVTPEVLKRAFKAFKKRLKLTQLDHESSLGGGAFGGGRRSRVAAISPPNQYPPEVWDALVAQGRLRKTGPGQYELVQ